MSIYAIQEKRAEGLTPGQLHAIRGLAPFAMEQATVYLDKGEPLPPMDEVLAPVFTALGIAEKDWDEVCEMMYIHIDYLTSEHKKKLN